MDAMGWGMDHRFFNEGDVPVHAIWFVVGREADRREPTE